jgi:hypothetical protein
MSRIDSLLRTISKRHSDASNDEIDFIINSDPSDNKIFSEWMAHKVFVDEEDAAYVADVAQYMATLHRSKTFDANLKLRTSVDKVVSALVKAAPPATVANLARLRRCPNYSRDIVFEDNRFVILEPNTHPDSCCYGEGSNRIWCVSNSEDASEFGRFDEIRNYGVGVKFFIVVNKILPLKHKFSHIGIVSYDTTIDAHSGGASDMQMIQQAKHRFTEMYGGDFAYTDEYLVKFLQELRERDIMMENYDSNNRMILASELEWYLGQRVFGNLLSMAGS